MNTDMTQNVPVERGCFAARLCDSLATRGVALEGRIFLGPDADARVLAHELAHVAQQGLWRGHAVPTAWTEAEAHLCALTGRQPRLPLDPRLPSCWEEVGHYYTVYYVLLCVGVRDPLARRIAFYAQMPDEISDLDAVRAGLSMATADVPAGIGEWLHENTIGAATDAFLWVNNGFASMLPYGGGYMGHRPPTRTFTDFNRGLDVQAGLHALTGAPAEAETARRSRILQTINPITNTMEYGLALHALGDCYAHREADGARMFPPLTGHAPDSLASRVPGAGHIPEMPVHPDAVGPHHSDLYLRYAADMYRAFLNTIPAGSRSAPTIDLSAMTTNLRTIPAATDSAADTEAEHQRQIRALRAFAGATPLSVVMNGYDPENQGDVPIDDFRPGNTDIRVTRMEVQQALRRANEWCRGGG